MTTITGITYEFGTTEPVCRKGADGAHDWRAPHALVGGIKDNPGVYGHGGGVIIREVCGHCGLYRVLNTWDSHPENGSVIETVRYEDADAESREWIDRRAMDDNA